MRMPSTVSIRFVKQDCWIGAYWRESWSHVMYGNPPYRKVTADGRWGRDWLRVYICIVPCFPIVLEWRNK